MSNILRSKKLIFSEKSLSMCVEANRDMFQEVAVPETSPSVTASQDKKAVHILRRFMEC